MLVFTDSWLEKLREQYERLPMYSRPIIYHIALRDKYRYLRDEIEEYMLLVPEEARVDLIARLQTGDHIFQTHRELVIGALLVNAYQVVLEYEKEYRIDDNLLTPDWTLYSDACNPQCVVEVVTDNPSKDTVSRDLAHGYLYSRLQEIELGAVLSVDIEDTVDIEQQVSARIARNVKIWLNTNPIEGKTRNFEGIEIKFLKWNEKFPRVQLFGSANAFMVDSTPLKEKILNKANKYKQIVGENVPLVVAIYSEFRTGRGFDDLLKALFGDGGLFVNADFLSGVMWLYRDIDMKVHLVENPNATVKLPAELRNEKSDYSNNLKLLGKRLILRDAESVKEYVDGIDFFWKQIVKLHTTLYLVSRIVHFPFDLLGVKETTFFSTVVSHFVDIAVLSLNNLINDEGNMLEFKSRIFELMKPEYHDAFSSQLQKAEFNDTLSSLFETVKAITNNRIVRSASDLPIGASLTFDELELLRDGVTCLYNALEFANIDYTWVVVDYALESNESDIDKILDNVAKDSYILNAPEEHPAMWERYTKCLNTKQLEIINQYRVKFGLPEA